MQSYPCLEGLLRFPCLAASNARTHTHTNHQAYVDLDSMPQPHRRKRKLKAHVYEPSICCPLLPVSQNARRQCSGLLYAFSPSERSRSHIPVPPKRRRAMAAAAAAATAMPLWHGHRCPQPPRGNCSDAMRRTTAAGWWVTITQVRPPALTLLVAARDGDILETGG